MLGVQPGHLWVGHVGRVGVGVVHVQARHLCRQACQRGLCQHPGRRAVCQQVGDAVGGVAGVYRHVGSAGLEHTQHADQPVAIARQAQGDTVADGYTQRHQAVGQLVGLLVELRIGKRLVALDHRQGGRQLGCAGLDQRVHGIALRIHADRVVEPAQHLLTLAMRQYRQALQLCIWRLLQGVHQAGQYLLELPAQAVRAPLRQALHGQAQVFTQVIHANGQRVVGTFLSANDVDAWRYGDDLVSITGVAVAVVEHAVEQRRRCGHAAATLGQCQRGLFMGQQAAQTLMGSQQPVAHAQCPQVDAQWQGIDEHAQRLLAALAGGHAPEQDAAEHHGLAARQLADQPGKAQVQHAGRADTQLPGLAAQALRQGGWQGQARLLQRLIGSGLHAKCKGGLVDITQHGFEEPGMGLLIQRLARSRQHVAKWHWRR